MTRDNRKFNDRGYRKLFSIPGLLEELLRHFVHVDIVDRIDFTTLRPVDPSSVSESWTASEADLLWEVATQDGLLLIYILIEFQSTSFRFMALRILHHITSLYASMLPGWRTPREVSNTKGLKHRRLPPVLPIVVYQGTRPWHAPFDVRDVIEAAGPGLTALVPSFRYYLLSLRDQPREVLQAMDSIVAKIFPIEAAAMDDLRLAVAELGRLLDAVDPHLRALIRDWVGERLSRREIVLGVALLNGKEDPDMLEEAIDKFKRDAVREATAELRKQLKQAQQEIQAAELERQVAEQVAERERQAAEQERQAIESALKESQAARRALEAEIRRLREQQP